MWIFYVCKAFSVSYNQTDTAARLEKIRSDTSGDGASSPGP
jgi:hypothetical protein